MQGPDLERSVTIGGETVTVGQLLDSWCAIKPRRVPTKAHAEQSAAIIKFEPRDIQSGARWFAFIEQLASAGWSKADIATFVWECLLSGATIPSPPAAVAAALLADAEAECAALRERAQARLAEAGQDDKLAAWPHVALAVAALADGELDASGLLNALPEAFVKGGFRFPLGCELSRTLLQRLDPPNAEKLYLAHVAQTNFSLQMVEELALYLDGVLPPGDAVDAALRAVYAKHLRPGVESPQLAKILQRTPRELDGNGLHARGRANLSWVLKELESERMRAELPGVALESCVARVPVAKAGELADLSAWKTAKPARREAIAKLVAEALCKAFGKASFRFDGMLEVQGTPVAVFAPKTGKLRLSLIPGGTFARGFSPDEEAQLRALSKANAGVSNHFEQFDALLAGIDAMRPVQQITLAPFLIGQANAGHKDIPALVKALRKGPYRLPTEAEWEYASRAGTTGSLSAFGAELPEEGQLRVMKKAKPEDGNAFALAGMGLLPELCADAFRET